MMLMSGKEYVDSLKGRKVEVYAFGEKIEKPCEHPLLKPSLNSIAATYDIAFDPKYTQLATATSHLTGKKINRFTHIHCSIDDLVKKVKLLRVLGQKTGTCFQRCVGWDALNALSIVTYEIDQKHKTEYHKHFIEFLKHVQSKDLTCAGAMTDVKGDRSLRPSEQADPDLYVHVVEKRDDGIIVRGAKVHITGVVHSHEIIVMPTRALTEKDKDYAVSFAVPTDTEGITLIVGRQMGDLRKLRGEYFDLGNFKYGAAGHEALVIFDDVFIPWNRVFMCGEYEFAGQLVETFASYHRQSYGGCKVGLGDVLIGAAALAAKYNGVLKASHIRSKLVDMVYLNETLHACGLACSYEGFKTSSGTFRVDSMLANICKLNVTKFPYEIARLAHDIAGGLIATMPSEKDYKDPKLGKLIEKYLRGVSDVPTEHRMKIFRLIENMTMSTGYLVESMHGAGSPEAQRIMISRLANFEEKMKLAKILTGIEK
nr:4-hydroxyphenylacetate 3-hydroxylase family protein [Candidatus Baldrarchaeota archaeon]